jgi:hypothetical protein
LQVSRRIDVDLAAFELPCDQAAIRIAQQESGARIPSQSQQVCELACWEDCRNSSDTRILRSDNRGFTRRGVGINQATQVLNAQSRLIANQQQRRLCLRIVIPQRRNAGLNRSSDPLSPMGIQDHTRIAKIESGRDRFIACAKHNKDRPGARLVNDANRPAQQCFAANPNQLLRLAKSAAGSGSEKDCRHRHRIQFRTRAQFELDLKLAKARD